MDRLKNVSQIVLMIAIPILILTLSQNIIYRLPDAYLYYFNDSQCLDEIYVSMSNSEMADALTDLLNTFRPDPDQFNIYVDTGYDQLGILDSRDTYNLLMMKNALDLSALLCGAALILTAAGFFFLLRNDEKKKLRISFQIGAFLSGVLLAAQAVCLPAETLRGRIFTMIGIRPFHEDSILQIMMGDGFWTMMTIFLTLAGILILGIGAYLQYRLTRPPRIFY